ncbi:hypothetical protein EAS64_29785 [Trebonia kvetii]|uniref:Uncharacterized protein n=1 Tax=Trebonia kvetii TaxID=2480626 RepID=A0A6P2BS36_9ACTN|nr:hypothetical protein [Trebonia kvetii]TVZ01668.1 hypothetical protein EAS64_29785 [Trebonia kvetii]
MSGDSFDANGEAHEALSTAVSSYGARVLGDPRILGNLVTDLLPDMPRERSLLVAAAEAGVAAELTQHVEGQHLDVETAIALVARSLTENRLLDPAASIWVSTEYAQALGYQVRPQAAPTVVHKVLAPTPTETVAPPQSPPVAPLPTVPPPPAKSEPSFTPAASSGGETRIDLRPAPRFTPAPPPPAAPRNPVPPAAVPPAAPPQDPWPPAPASAGDLWQQPTQASIQDPWAKAAAAPPAQPAPQPQNAWQQPAPPGPAQPGQAQPWPTPSSGAGSPPWPSVGGSGPRRPRRGLLLGGTIAVIIVLYLVIAAVAQTFPFSKATPKPSAGPKVVVSTTPAVIPSTTPPVIPSTTPPVVPSTTRPAGPSLAAGVKPLKVLLPTDIADASTECSTQTDIPWTNPGLVRALDCTAPDMAGGDIFGYQVDNNRDFAKAWANYNAWAKFGKSSSESCPPPSGQSQAGPIEWNNNNFPSRAGQVLECFTASKGEGVYVWTYPTENTFIIVQAPKSWSFSQLHEWWRVDAA